MTTATYDTEMIRNINLFESITDVDVRDAIIKEDEAYFVVPEGKAGMAIGKGGKVVQKVQNKLDRDIKIYEYNDNLGAFINNIVPADIRGVDIEGDKVEIHETTKEELSEKTGIRSNPSARSLQGLTELKR